MPSSIKVAPVEFLLKKIEGIFLVKVQSISNKLLRLNRLVFRVEDIIGF